MSTPARVLVFIADCLGFALVCYWSVLLFRLDGPADLASAMHKMTGIAIPTLVIMAAIGILAGIVEGLAPVLEEALPILRSRIKAYTAARMMVFPKARLHRRGFFGK